MAEFLQIQHNLVNIHLELPRSKLIYLMYAVGSIMPCMIGGTYSKLLFQIEEDKSQHCIDQKLLIKGLKLNLLKTFIITFNESYKQG